MSSLYHFVITVDKSVRHDKHNVLVKAEDPDRACELLGEWFIENSHGEDMLENVNLIKSTPLESEDDVIYSDYETK